MIEVSSKVPKKNINDSDARIKVKQFVKSLRKDCGGAVGFYKKLYGVAPVGNQSGTLNNYVNRGVYSPEFMALLTEKFDLFEKTLGEVYFGEKPDDTEVGQG